jgi:hypothetical protein
MKKYLYQQIDYLDNLFTKEKEFNNDELLANWAKYLCILTSGLIENSIKALVMEYSTNCSSPYVQNYIETTLQNLTNLKVKKIIDFLKKFNDDWGNKFENEISDEEKDAIDSIIANRNNIVHGEYGGGLTYIRIKNYYNDAKKVISLLESIIIK